MKKISIFLLTVLLVIPFSASAAIMFDASSTANHASGATSTTWTHNVTTTANAILFVGVNVNGGAIVSVTASGTAMTEVGQIETAQNATSTIWCLSAPPTGSVTMKAVWSSGGSFGAAAVSYAGASQTCTLDASSTQSASTGSTFPVGITTVADSAWPAAFITSNQAAQISASGASTTLRSANPTVNNVAMFDKNQSLSPPQNASMTAAGTSGYWNGMSFSFAPAATVATTKRRQPIIVNAN